MQLAPGTYTVTASGGGLPDPITRTVVLGNDNVRLNFDENPNGATVAVSPGDQANVTLGSSPRCNPVCALKLRANRLG